MQPSNAHDAPRVAASASSQIIEESFDWHPARHGLGAQDERPRTYQYSVYLPPGYDSEAVHRFPVTFLLHGANGDHQQWLREGAVQATMDRLIAEGLVEPMVVVMPGHKHGWWVDGARDLAETPFLHELMPRIRRRFAVRADRAGTFIAGNSAGGHAAVRFALKHPDMFGAAAALSPAVYRDVPPTSSAHKDGQFAREPGGALDPETWQSFNYHGLVESYQAQDLRVPFFVSTGDRDKFGIRDVARELYEELNAMQPGVVFTEYPGCHEWSVFGPSFAAAAPFLSDTLKAAQRQTLRAV